MGTAFLYGNGGSGGASLNFKVVGGTTEPTNPKENMIWINTDVDMNGWVFSVMPPASWQWVSDAGVIATLNGVTLTKKNSGKALFTWAYNGTYTIPVLFSDSQDAAALSSDNTDQPAGPITIDGKIWYCTWPGIYGLHTGDLRTPSMVQIPGTVANASVVYHILAESYEKQSDLTGMVWIATGTSCTVEFNALKKNCIQVYPAAAKQYVSGVWVDKVAKSYKSGAWADWSVELYPPSSNWNAATNGRGYAGISNEGIELQEEWISYSQYQQVTTKTKWNVTPYKKLCARMKSSGTGCTKVVALSTAADSNVYSSSFVVKVTNNTQTAGAILECDISGLSGEYYVAVGQCASSGASNNYTVFDKVWME